jgi:tetratricopeptide (TPR) repeat protein
MHATGEGYRFVAPPPDRRFAPATPTVGREAELSRLEELLNRAAAGDRQIVFVTGEPGIGKSALIELFLAHLENRGRSEVPGGPKVRPARAWIGRGQCIEQEGGGESYRPVLEALFRLAHGAGEGERIKAVLHRHAPSWLLELPALLEPAEREALQRQVLPAPARMLRQLAEALEVLSVEAGGEPPVVILVFEDLHWSDGATLDLIATLARRRDRAHLLVLCTFRAMELWASNHPLRRLRESLTGDDPITELGLGGLSEADVHRYLEVRFPAAESSVLLGPLLHRRTDGNPLLLTEIIRELGARIFGGDSARWVLGGGAAEIDAMLPANVRQFMKGLAERLSPNDRRILEAASVEGIEFSVTAVAAALECSAADVEDRCAELAEHQMFLRFAGDDTWPDGTPATRYALRHAMHRELWLERVAPNRLEEWHRRIGLRKEAAHGERAGELAADLAVHFESGRDYARAIAYLELASRRAQQRAALSEADERLRRAFVLLDRLPAGRARLETELGLQLGLGSLRAMSDGFTAEATLAPYQRAYAVCREIGETPAHFHSLFGLCRFFWMKGELDPARELAGQLLRRAGDDPLQAIAAHAAFGSIATCRGEFQNAMPHLEKGLSLCEAHWSESLVPVFGNDLSGLCRGTLAANLQLLGYPDRALAQSQADRERARRAGHPFVHVATAWGALILHHMRRDRTQTSRFTSKLMSIASSHEFQAFAPFGDLFRGWYEVTGGRRKESLLSAAPSKRCVREAGGSTNRVHSACSPRDIDPWDGLPRGVASSPKR